MNPLLNLLYRLQRQLWRVFRHVALMVRDCDEAIAWLTEKLGFTLVADQYQPEPDKRWVLVAPPGAGDNATPKSAHPQRAHHPRKPDRLRVGLLHLLRQIVGVFTCS